MTAALAVTRLIVVLITIVAVLVAALVVVARVSVALSLALGVASGFVSIVSTVASDVSGVTLEVFSLGSVPVVVVAIVVALIVVVALGMFFLVVGVAMSRRVAVAIVVMASSCVTGHDERVAIDRLMIALGLSVSQRNAVSNPGQAAQLAMQVPFIALLPQPRLIHSIKKLYAPDE